MGGNLGAEEANALRAAFLSLLAGAVFWGGGQRGRSSRFAAVYVMLGCVDRLAEQAMNKVTTVASACTRKRLRVSGLKSV